MVWHSRPMDWLICGNVGFGKTEVAMHALFRTVVNRRQAAMLAPTGVLAAQHYKNIGRRMGEETEHGFNMALLSKISNGTRVRVRPLVSIPTYDRS